MGQLKWVGIVVWLAAFAAPAVAQQGVLENRARVMTEMGKAFRVVVSESRRSEPNMGKLALNVEILAGNVPLIGPLFEDDIIPAGSEASPKIWTEPVAFAKAVSAMESAVAELVIAVNDGDKASRKLAVRAVNAACSICHQKFRVKSQ